MSKNQRFLLLVLVDAILIALSIYTSYLLRFDFRIPNKFSPTFPYVIPLYVLLILFGLYIFKIYKRVWQYASVGDLISIFKGALFGSLLFFCFHLFIIEFLNDRIVVPRSIYFISTINSFVLIAGTRFVWRLVRDNYIKIQPHHKKALLIGAGAAGSQVAREMKHVHSEFYPIAFIDDDLSKKGLEVMGVPVIGDRSFIPEAITLLKIDQVVITMPEAKRDYITEILDICKKMDCDVKILPRITDFIDGKYSINKIRDISVEDLLGREPVKVDLESISGYINAQVVLVTGSGGSIGSELSRQIARFEPKKLLLLGHGENSIYEIDMELRNKFPELDVVPIIADIQDFNRLHEVFKTYKPNVVFHAAAHKHVPMMEMNPIEAIKNNILGTKNVAECSHEFKVDRFVMISTDKAVNPTNVMGASKRFAELIIQNLNKVSDTKFSAVRFGNVLGSRGSVVPLFKRQILQGGPVTVTHPEMVRYFMTIPEAVQLVIQTGAISTGGEVFILDMGEPVKIDQLAKDLIRLSGLEPNKDIEIKYSGIRPGEKLYEELLTSEEGAKATKHDRIFVAKGEDNVDIDKLVSVLNKMEDISKNAYNGVHNDEIRGLLKMAVPTYHYNNDLNQQFGAKEALQASLEMIATIENNS